MCVCVCVCVCVVVCMYVCVVVHIIIYAYWCKWAFEPFFARTDVQTGSRSPYNYMYITPDTYSSLNKLEYMYILTIPKHSL